MTIIKKTFTLFITVILLLSCNTETSSEGNRTPIEEQELLVFVASSLIDVITEISETFESENGVRVKLSSASSGTLARQIEQGALPNIFISANPMWINYLDSLDYILKDSKTKVAENEIVLVTYNDSKLRNVIVDSTSNISNLLGKGKLSIGDPMHVPVGIYAKQSLEFLGWYSIVKRNILPAKDARTTLMYVELEEASLAVVYKTDALKSNKVKELYSFPRESHSKIEYIAGVCKNTHLSTVFLEYLNSKSAEVIWQKHGFFLKKNN